MFSAPIFYGSFVLFGAAVVANLRPLKYIAAWVALNIVLFDYLEAIRRRPEEVFLAGLRWSLPLHLLHLISLLNIYSFYSPLGVKSFSTSST